MLCSQRPLSLLLVLGLLGGLATGGCGAKKKTDGLAEIAAFQDKATPVIAQLRALAGKLAARPAATKEAPAGVKPSCNVLNIANAEKFNDVFLYAKDLDDLTKEAELDDRVFNDELVRKATTIVEAKRLIGGEASAPITAEMADYEVEAIRIALTGLGALQYAFIVEHTASSPAVTDTSTKTFKPGSVTVAAVLVDLATGKALDAFEATGTNSDAVTTREYQAGSDRVQEDLRMRTFEAVEAACRARYGLPPK